MGAWWAGILVALLPEGAEGLLGAGGKSALGQPLCGGQGALEAAPGALSKEGPFCPRTWGLSHPETPSCLSCEASFFRGTAPGPLPSSCRSSAGWEGPGVPRWGRLCRVCLCVNVNECVTAGPRAGVYKCASMNQCVSVCDFVSVCA